MTNHEPGENASIETKSPADMVAPADAGKVRVYDDFSDVKKPIPPKTDRKIHDPWGLSRLG